MTISIEYEAEKVLDLPYREIIEDTVLAALDYEGCPYEAEVNVILTDNDAIQEINREHRQIDAPTDVLSFPMVDYESPSDFDHVEDACRMRQIFDCRIHAGQPYNESLTLEKMARDAWGLPLNVQPFVVDEILTPDIHTANWGGLLWHLHQVPGHSPDSIVYDLPDEGIMFTGDVIFAGSIGRTDLPGGNLRLLKQGIEKKVLNQPATTMIFPGHGPYTNVKNELLTNPFIS